ncbi:MAG: hypothetical protein GH155_03490 [Spirochaeta sp.]|nr:hypothetical protein [Spirochaeta sp.]
MKPLGVGEVLAQRANRTAIFPLITLLILSCAGRSVKENRIPEIIPENRSEKTRSIITEATPATPLGSDTRYSAKLREALAAEDQDRTQYYLTQLLAEEPEPHIRLEASLQLADIYYLKRRYEDAFQLYTQLLPLIDGNLPVAEEEYNIAILRMAEISLFKRKDEELAQEYYSKLNSNALAPIYNESCKYLERKLLLKEISPALLGLSDNNISAIEVDDDDLWVGTWDGGLARYSLSNKETMVFRTGGKSLTPNSVRSIEITPESVWIGSYRELSVYSKIDSSWKIIPEFSGANSTRIETIKAMKDTIYIGTLGRGLWRLKNNNWQRLNAAPLPGAFINCLENIGSLLYIGTMNLGVVLLDIETGFFSTFDRINPGVEARNITMLLAQSMDTIWIGTYGRGLYNWQEKNNKLVHYIKSSGQIADDWILSGVKTGRALYFGTFGGGISFIFLNSGKWQRIGLNQGLPSLDISVLAYLAAPVGSLFAGTLGGGVVELDEALLNEN